MVWTKAQSIAIALTPIIPSLLSMAASVTIIVMILRSVTRLTKPYRRIIFGMCSYDVIFSIGTLQSSFPTPAGSQTWAFGNHASCVAQGFLLQAGLVGSRLYTLSLAIFYLCLIKLEIKEDKFCRRVEPFLHLIPNLYAIITAIYAAAIDLYHYAGNTCWIAARPCDDGDVECDSEKEGKFVFIYRFYATMLPYLISLIGCLIIMILISWKAMMLSVKNQRWSIQWRKKSGNMPTSAKQETEPNTHTRRENRLEAQEQEAKVEEEKEAEIPHETQQIMNTASFWSPSRTIGPSKEVLAQACMFMAAFLITSVFSFVNRMVENDSDENQQFWLQILANILIPMTGLFNVLIYTRPHVISLRNRFRHYSWWKAFKIVVERGGDHGGIDRRRGQRRARRLSWISRQNPSSAGSGAASRSNQRTTRSRRGNFTVDGRRPQGSVNGQNIILPCGQLDLSDAIGEDSNSSIVDEISGSADNEEQQKSKDAVTSGNIRDIEKNCDDTTAFVTVQIHPLSTIKDDNGSESYEVENDEEVTMKHNLLSGNQDYSEIMRAVDEIDEIEK